MKLDSAPLSLTFISQPESNSELKDDTDSNLKIVSLGEKPSFCATPVEDTDAPLTLTGTPLPSRAGLSSRSNRQSASVVFVTTFLTIFLAEIGDKTQLSTLLMSAQSHSPWVVFLGSAAALVTTSLLGVVLGSWIASRLSPKIVEKAAGIILLLISLLLFWDVLNSP